MQKLELYIGLYIGTKPLSAMDTSRNQDDLDLTQAQCPRSIRPSEKELEVQNKQKNPKFKTNWHPVW
jgi:hypothetical protein